MGWRELAPRLVEAGLTVATHDPEALIGKALWSARRLVVCIDGHGYWFRHKPYEPAGYDPTSQI